jgi:hypothetical protein
MKRLHTAPINLADLPDLVSPRGYLFKRVVQGETAEGLKGSRVSMTVISWPDGYCVPHGEAHQFEIHNLAEEIFVLKGGIAFDHWYAMDALAYMNHPPYWVHPTVQRAVGDLVMLLKTSYDATVEFMDIPENWDGVEFFAPPTRSEGVTKLQLDDLPWQAVLGPDGSPSGMDAKQIWVDRDDGWVTWLMRVPPGWQGSGPRRELPGGDELFVLEGDFTVAYDGAQRLTANGYFCEPDRFVDGGAIERSDQGCLAIRWTKGAGVPRLGEAR